MLTVVVLLLAVHVAVQGVDATPPHIVLLVGDDMGWNDVSFTNDANGMITPNLQYLANNGVILNSSYVQPVCSPTRSSFLTGIYPYHMGMQSGVIDMNKEQFLSTNYSTLPEKLKESGYSSHIVGKWHLGHCNWTYTPTGRGFDSHGGLLLGSGDHYTHKRKGGFDFWKDRVVDHSYDGNHTTDAFTDIAVNVINNHNTSTPLFLYVAYTAAHTPLDDEPLYVNMYNDSHGDASRQTFSGMVTHLDASIGTIVDALDDRSMLDNLVLVFLSDNGGDSSKGASNFPLRGKKGSLWEGGTRTPALVYSKTLLNQTGYVHNGMIHAVDWFSTFLDIAGVDNQDSVDGVSQWDMISNNSESNRDEFVYNINTVANVSAIRKGDYKLVRGSGSRDKLFNIANDPVENDDLYNSEPGMVTIMQNRLDELIQSEVPFTVLQENSLSYPSNWGKVWSPGWCAGDQ